MQHDNFRHLCKRVEDIEVEVDWDYCPYCGHRLRQITKGKPENGVYYFGSLKLDSKRVREET